MRTTIQNRVPRAAIQPATSISGQQAAARVDNRRQPAVQRQLDSASRLGHRFDAEEVQPTLTLGPVDDRYEQEANQVAGRALAAMDPQGQAATAASAQVTPMPGTGAVQREASAGAINAADGGPVPADVTTAINSARGGGQPLPGHIRSPMEQTLGANFSQVRIHTDAQADRLNQRLQARAFTTNRDIFLRRGEYDPESQTGQAVLAHELTHVVQQGGKERGIQRLPNAFERAGVLRDISDVVGGVGMGIFSGGQSLYQRLRGRRRRRRGR